MEFDFTKSPTRPTCVFFVVDHSKARAVAAARAAQLAHESLSASNPANVAGAAGDAGSQPSAVPSNSPADNAASSLEGGAGDAAALEGSAS